MYEVVGLERRKGEYQGQSYDNMMVHCIRPCDTSKDEEGSITEILKIKFELFDADIVVGSKVDPVYDRYGRIRSIDILI